VVVKTDFNQNDKLEIFGTIKEGDVILSRATDEIIPGTKLIGKIVHK